MSMVEQKENRAQLTKLIYSTKKKEIDKKWLLNVQYSIHVHTVIKTDDFKVLQV